MILALTELRNRRGITHFTNNLTNKNIAVHHELNEREARVLLESLGGSFRLGKLRKSC